MITKFFEISGTFLYNKSGLCTSLQFYWATQYSFNLTILSLATNRTIASLLWRYFNLFRRPIRPISLSMLSAFLLPFFALTKKRNT